MNIALYGRPRGGEQNRLSAWSLKERGIIDSDRFAEGVWIGSSVMRWLGPEGGGDSLVIDLDERGTPFGERLRGSVVLHPTTRTDLDLAIDAAGEHRWWPVAPLARIEVDISSAKGSMRFSGDGYYDANAGSAPIESAFESWTWSRGTRAGFRKLDEALMTYDVIPTSGRPRRSLAFRVSTQGDVDVFEDRCTRIHALPRTFWGLEREARTDSGHRAKIHRTFEDGPFYSRSLVETRLGGRSFQAIHETLAAHRLKEEWVRVFTTYRM